MQPSRNRRVGKAPDANASGGVPTIQPCIGIDGGHGARAPLPTLRSSHAGRYASIHSSQIEGSIFFFTVVLADRRSNLLIDEIDRFRHSYRVAQQDYPFETIAICVLPDHLHALWAMPEGDADFSKRWSLIKSGFSRGMSPQIHDQRVKSPNGKKASGNAAIGSTPFATMPISNGMSITFISIL